MSLYQPALSHPDLENVNDSVPRTVRQASNLTITTSTTLVASDLVHAIEPYKTYLVDVLLLIELEAGASGLKASITGPSTPDDVALLAELWNGVTPAIAVHEAQDDYFEVSNVMAQAGVHTLKITGIIENGANAGNVSINFAQRTSDAGDTILQRGSYFTIKEIA